MARLGVDIMRARVNDKTTPVQVIETSIRERILETNSAVLKRLQQRFENKLSTVTRVTENAHKLKFHNSKVI